MVGTDDRVGAVLDRKTRIFGFHWTMTSLRYRIRSGDTGFYFHPWEVDEGPRRAARSWRERVFHRHTGRWMVESVSRILERFQGRVVTAADAAQRFLASAS